MEGGALRAVKIAAIAMGVLIVLGTSIVLVTIVKRVTANRDAPAQHALAVPAAHFAATLDEPEGTAIEGISDLNGRLAIRLRGGGPDRVVVIDAASGAVVGRVTLAR